MPTTYDITFNWVSTSVAVAVAAAAAPDPAQIQTRLRREMRAAQSVADVFLAPTTPFPPFASGVPADPSSLLLNDVLTVPVSLAGVPAISIPVATAPSALSPGFGAASGARRRGVPKGRRRDGGGERGVDAVVVGRRDGGGDAGGEGDGETERDEGTCRLPLGMQVRCM